MIATGVVGFRLMDLAIRPPPTKGPTGSIAPPQVVAGPGFIAGTF